MDEGALLDERSLARLRWRCRRGMLENDLFIERFFERHGPQLTVGEGRALGELMELPDNDLLDLLLGRKGPEAAGLGPEAARMLQKLRAPAAAAAGRDR